MNYITIARVFNDARPKYIESLRDIMSPHDLERTLDLTTRYTTQIHDRIKAQQKRKFEVLCSEHHRPTHITPDRTNPQQRCSVVNLS